MNNIILHIPHSSLELPEIFWDNVICDNSKIDNFNIKITDLYINELFDSGNYEKVIAPYSRIYCDIEKYVDEDKEIMSKFGMGFVYTHTHQGEKFLEATHDYKQKVFNDYYKKIHFELDRVVERSVKESQTILLDCHSFNKDIIMFQDKKENLPDICIGYDELYYNDTLVDFIKRYFEELGYNVAFNTPYSGTMIPDKYIVNKVNNLYCVMIEINKNLYLNDDYQKNKHFNLLKKQINDLLNKLEYFNFETKHN